MLKEISWSDYLAFIGVSSFIYYAYVLFVYYRHDLVRLSKNRPATIGPLSLLAASPPPVINESDYLPKVLGSGSSQTMIPLLEEVKAYLEEAGNNETTKEVLLQCLKVIAGKYPPVPDSDDRDSVIKVIMAETEMNCAVFLSESEVRGIWRGA